MKVDTEGQIEWEVVSDVVRGTGQAIQLDAEGNYVIVGRAQGTEDPDDVFVARYRPGEVTRLEPIQNEFRSSLKVYPNPVSSYFVLDLETSSPGQRTVELFDALGRFVLHRIEWSNSPRIRVDLEEFGLPSGIYFVRVSAGDAQTTVPLTLISRW